MTGPDKSGEDSQTYSAIGRGRKVAGVDGDRTMISRGQDQDSASTQWTRANKVQSLWASLLFGRLRLALSAVLL